jgi:hypothetical protein
MRRDSKFETNPPIFFFIDVICPRPELARGRSQMVLKNTVWGLTCTNLFVGVVLGDGLGALGHGVLGQLAGKDEADSRLDLAGRDGVALVVARQAARLGGNALENVVHKRVHDDHGLLGHSSVGVHLLEHLVDVRGVRVGVRLLAALGAVFLLGSGLASLAGSLSGCLCLPRERENRWNEKKAPKQKKDKKAT